MNCNQFQQRMDLLLDQRQKVQCDQSLCEHASQCVGCRERLQVWTNISDSGFFQQPQQSPQPLSDVARQPTSDHRLGMIVALAAAILLIVSAAWRLSTPSGPSTTSLASASPAASQAQNTLRENSLIGATNSPDSDSPNHPEQLAIGDLQLPWESAPWWTAVSDEQWVDRTIPVVDSVRMGVAPIGRSMKQAFAILLIQSDSAPINSLPIAPDVPSDAFGEQTSALQPPDRFILLA